MKSTNISSNALAIGGPNGDSIANLSTFLYNILLNIKYDSLVAKDRRSLNSLFSNYEQSRCFKKILVQLSMVSSRRTLVKRESMSKFPMKLLESCSTTLVEKLKESLTVYFLLVNGSKIDTKYFASLYVGVFKADKIGLKGGQPSTHFLCTIQEPYIIQDAVPTGLRCFRVSSDMLVESTSFL